MNNPDDTEKPKRSLVKYGLITGACLVLGIVVNCLIIGYVKTEERDPRWKEILSYFSIGFLCIATVIFLCCYAHWRKCKAGLAGHDEETAHRLLKFYTKLANFSAIIGLSLLLWSMVGIKITSDRRMEWLEIASALCFFMGIIFEFVSIFYFIRLILLPGRKKRVIYTGLPVAIITLLGIVMFFILTGG
ncbi:MAG: hypothetical protein ACYS8W_10335 [Planctomycetota bacterium]|jgi:hypothetical protein